MNTNDRTPSITTIPPQNQPYVLKKGCAFCGGYKPIWAFHVRRASSDGLQSYCAECNIKRQYMHPGGAAVKNRRPW